MFRSVLVPLDGSSLAERALSRAANVAQQLGVDLVVYRAVADPDAIPVRRQEMDQRLQALGIMANALQVEAVTDPAEGILQALGGLQKPLLVMATHGNGGLGRLLGTTTEDVLAAYHGPVLVVGPAVTSHQPTTEGRTVVCLDGSTASEESAHDALDWSARFHTEPWVITVLDPGIAERAARATAGGIDVTEAAQVHRVADKLRDAGVPAEWEVLHADHAVAPIVEFARRLPASLIVMSTHGRTGLRRVVMGSVAMGVALNAPCPVLIRRPLRLADAEGDVVIDLEQAPASDRAGRTSAGGTSRA